MSRVRRICYVTGTRADFGLMVSTLHAIAADARLDLGLAVTGMHLAQRHGMTVREVEAEGLRIDATIPVELEPPGGATMARNIGHMTVGLVDAFERIEPDLVLLLGDRGEMLAGALAAAHLGIGIAHLHGGERSGTIDESVRHAISKLAHHHLVATQASRDRLIRMGEDPQHIVVVGAPGLDGLTALERADRSELCASVGFDPGRPMALMLFHPVLQERASAAAQTAAILDSLTALRWQTLALMPNADAGSERVREQLLHRRDEAGLVVRTHLTRSEFVSWMAACDVMVGNSSSGIIEAASFGTPVVNVGSRQQLRERNANVNDTDADAASITAALRCAAARGRLPVSNVYGDGHAGARIVELLASADLTLAQRAKCNAY